MVYERLPKIKTLYHVFITMIVKNRIKLRKFGAISI